MAVAGPMPERRLLIAGPGPQIGMNVSRQSDNLLHHSRSETLLTTAGPGDSRQRAPVRLSAQLAAVRSRRRHHVAAYAIPVSLAYATLAGLPPQIGVYGYLMGGLGYALAGSSRYLAIGPTSAISLMIAGTVGDMAGDDGALRCDRHGRGTRGRPVLPDRLGVQAQRAGQADQRQRADRLQGRCRVDHRDHPAPGAARRRGGGHNVPERLVTLAGQLGATNLATLA